MSFTDNLNQGDSKEPVRKKTIRMKEGGLPDPNMVVEVPIDRPHINYDMDSEDKSASKSSRPSLNEAYFGESHHNIDSEQVIVHNSQEHAEVTHNTQQAQRPVQNGRTMQRKPAQQGQRPVQNGQRPVQNGQRPAQQGQRPVQRSVQNGQQISHQGQQPVQNPQNQPSKKKKSKLPLVLIGVVVLLAIAFVALKLKGGKVEDVPQEVVYEKTGRYAYESLKQSLITLATTDFSKDDIKPEDILSQIDNVVGTSDGDSYLAQEWAYVNGVALRQNFIKKVYSLVDFKYPMVNQLSTNGSIMTDSEGNPIMIESYMNNGEYVTVTVPDYAQLSVNMNADAETIRQMMKSSRYSEKDYTWNDEMTDLMLKYILEKSDIPTKTTEIAFNIRLGINGVPYIESDAELDDLLFGNNDLWEMCAQFSKIAVDWTGYIEIPYTEKEEVHNDEYDDWYKLFIKYYEEDNGVFDKNKSKWEPWYLRDEKNQYIYDENGEKVVNYYSVKDANGHDWIQPDETIFIDVEKFRKEPVEWNEESIIMYNWIGTNWIQNHYNGKGDTAFRVGDGSKDSPAGIGTTIITKVLCTDGKYHDVKVALLGYWTDKNAIDYAERFSTKNRGFTTSSVVQLICFEVSVENLEDQPIEFISSEMTLTDKNSNISSRTGTIYGFTETVNLAARGAKNGKSKTILNDWASSTELAQKYVCWGKSFGRNYSMVFFDCLAGTGYVPSYSAYEQFTGKSKLEN